MIKKLLRAVRAAVSPRPKAPEAKMFYQNNQDVDKDGTVDIALSVEWNAVANAVVYEVEITRWDAASSTWVNTGLGNMTPALIYSFVANTNFKYRARVRAQNAFGQPGLWTTNIYEASTGTTTFAAYSGLQPAGKSAPPPAPNLLTLAGSGYNTLGGFRCQVGWPVDFDDYDHSVLYIFPTNDRAGAMDSAITSKGGNSKASDIVQFDVGNLTPGATYYLWAQNYDTSGNPSAYYPTSATAGVPVTIPFTTTAEVEPTFFNEGNAALSAGDIGTPAWLKKTNAGTANPGSVVSGANLVYSDSSLSTGANPSGNWQCLGRCPSGQASMWLRVS